MGRSVGGSAGIARIALQTMRSTYQELDNMTAPLARRAGELLVDMVHLSLQALGGQATAVTQKQALYDRICEHVASHVRDPGLSVDQVAEALNCSRRHLHNAFSGRDQSLGGFIQQSRLELCMRELHSPALAHRTITEIAMGCGFGNSAHFSRAFKAYAGMSPSEFRALGH
ncbi:HTH-type transcriptional activator RhaR [bioreactor metagenome]|uniref:HTH-type transcriptional activator RhaR n=2 Tax=root TaxID=1 RepID=A0A645DTY3_9ZZZZ